MPTAYDVSAKKTVEIQDPKIITKITKRGRKIQMVTGKSPLTGISVYRIVSNTKA